MRSIAEDNLKKKVMQRKAGEVTPLPKKEKPAPPPPAEVSIDLSPLAAELKRGMDMNALTLKALVMAVDELKALKQQKAPVPPAPAKEWEFTVKKDYAGEMKITAKRKK